MNRPHKPTGAPIGDPAGLPDVGNMNGSLWLNPRRVLLFSTALTVLLGVSSSVPTG